jgi:hypothetical protein
MKGVVISTAPFDTVINPRLIHECIGVETINGLLAKGMEPFADIYEPNSIDEDTFNTHADSNVRIITFQSATGEIHSIPELYVEALPDANGVPYRCIMLGISLSAIPDDMDITDLKTEVGDMIFDYLGVRSEIKEVAYGEPSILTQDEHAAVELARVANVTNNVSSRLKVVQLTATVDELTQKIQVLEDYIKANLPP